MEGAGEAKAAWQAGKQATYTYTDRDVHSRLDAVHAAGMPTTVATSKPTHHYANNRGHFTYGKLLQHSTRACRAHA
jgi:hypothetical protein